MNYYFLVTLVLCMVYFESILSAGKPKTGADLAKAKKKYCKQELFDMHSANCYAQFGLDELKFPESDDVLKEYCDKVSSSNTFAAKYGEYCLSSTSQTLMSLATYNFGLVNKPYCSTKGKKKAEFVSWAKCGNAAKEKTIPCWERMINIMGNVMKVRESKKRLPLICCTYYEWIKCTGDALRSMGAKVCSKSASDGYVAHINKASVDSMNLICSKYDNDPEKCKPFMKEAITTRVKKAHKTPLLYVFEVFDKL